MGSSGIHHDLESSMRTIVHMAVTVTGVIACLVALASAGSLLVEALAGERKDLGAWGMAMLAVLILGQCRALWVLTVTGTGASRRVARTAHFGAGDR